MGNNKVFEKTQVECWPVLVASQISRNNVLVIVVKIYTEADFKDSWYCPILIDFFTYLQIFCPGWQVFIIPGNTLQIGVVALKQESYLLQVRMEIMSKNI